MSYKNFFYAVPATFLIIIIIDTLWLVELFRDFLLAKHPGGGKEIPAIHAFPELIWAILIVAAYVILCQGNYGKKQGMITRPILGMAFGLPGKLYQYADGETNMINIILLTFNTLLSGMGGGYITTVIYKPT